MQTELYIFFFTLYSSITFSCAWTIRNSPYKLESISRVYSSVHACLSCCLSLLYLLSFSSPFIHYLLITNSTVYVIYDTVFVFVFRQTIYNDFTLWLHHFIFLFSLYYLSLHPLFFPLACRVFLVEMSTFFLNYAWYVYKHHIYGIERLFSVYSTLFSYTVFRIMNLTHLLFYTFSFSIPCFIIFLLTSINYFWFYKLVSKVI